MRVGHSRRQAHKERVDTFLDADMTPDNKVQLSQWQHN